MKAWCWDSTKFCWWAIIGVLPGLGARAAPVAPLTTVWIFRENLHKSVPPEIILSHVKMAEKCIYVGIPSLEMTKFHFLHALPVLLLSSWQLWSQNYAISMYIVTYAYLFTKVTPLYAFDEKSIFWGILNSNIFRLSDNKNNPFQKYVFTLFRCFSPRFLWALNLFF